MRASNLEWNIFSFNLNDVIYFRPNVTAQLFQKFNPEEVTNVFENPPDVPFLILPKLFTYQV